MCWAKPHWAKKNDQRKVLGEKEETEGTRDLCQIQKKREEKSTMRRKRDLEFLLNLLEKIPT